MILGHFHFVCRPLIFWWWSCGIWVLLLQYLESIYYLYLACDKLGDRVVSAIFCTVHYASCWCAPAWSPSVHLAVWSSFWQILCLAVTEAACSAHLPHTTCLKLIKRTDNMKPYAQVRYIKACLCPVNLYAIRAFCVCNANTLWHTKWMFVCTM